MVIHQSGSCKSRSGLPDSPAIEVAVVKSRSGLPDSLAIKVAVEKDCSSEQSFKFGGLNETRAVIFLYCGYETNPAQLLDSLLNAKKRETPLCRHNEISLDLIESVQLSSAFQPALSAPQI